MSFGALFAVAKATDSGSSATAPRPPAVPPVLTGDASLGRAAALPALRPAAKKRRRAAPAPAPKPSPAPRRRATPAPSAPAPTPVAPVAPAPAPRPTPTPRPAPDPPEDFDDSG